MITWVYALHAYAQAQNFLSLVAVFVVCLDMYHAYRRVGRRQDACTCLPCSVIAAVLRCCINSAIFCGRGIRRDVSGIVNRCGGIVTHVWGGAVVKVIVCTCFWTPSPWILPSDLAYRPHSPGEVLQQKHTVWTLLIWQYYRTVALVVKWEYWVAT